MRVNYKGVVLKSILFFLTSISFHAISQNQYFGEVHGNFETTAQYYNPDSAIGAPIVRERMRMNSFANVNYTYGNSFRAGIRYESYLNALQGFDPRYSGTGIIYKYATYKSDDLEVTVGSFYEQFGSGLILRAYEERGLGYDNALDGIRLKYNPHKGIYLKGLTGKQRLFMGNGPGIVRGVDGEIQLNELLPKWEEKKTRITIGGSFVSKYQDSTGGIDRPVDGKNFHFLLPANVGSAGGRLSIARGGFVIGTEYVSKINDPTALNDYNFKRGQALLLTTSYSQTGLGINLSAKRVDNMNFRSDRDASLNSSLINYLPAMCKQHTYGLLTFYPYASQPNGEITFQAEVTYKIKKDSKLGGKYGTEILVNYSGANGIAKTALNDDSTSRKVYSSAFFKPGKVYFSDLVVEINKKFNKKVKGTFVYANQVYNKDVIQGLVGYGTIYSDIAVLDVTYKVKSDKAIRMEMQHLSTHQDHQNWAEGLVEYSHGEHWFVALLDQYNYVALPDKFNDEKKEEPKLRRLHYVNGSVGYIKNANRITLAYGKQRAGMFCVGGVCRTVPASNGITLSITSSF